MTDVNPKAIISWSHADPGWTQEQAEERLETVRAFADTLREAGVDADVDIYHTNEANDWTRWGPTLVGDPDRLVLIIVSEGWRRAWDGSGDPTVGAGASAEADVLRSQFRRNRDSFKKRIRLVCLPGDSDDEVPDGLDIVTRYHLPSIDRDGLEELLRDVLGGPRYVPAPLGPVASFDPAPRGIQAAPAVGGAATSSTAPASASTPASAAAPQHSWGPIGSPPTVAWRADGRLFVEEQASLTIHVLALDGYSVSARQMPGFEKRTKTYLRSSGLVADDVRIMVPNDPDGLTILVEPPRRPYDAVSRGDVIGLRLHGSGQVTVWRTLPRDSMGAVLDAGALVTDVTECLQLVAAAMGASPARIALAAEVGPATLITEGTLSSLGRSSATMLKTGRGPLQIPPDESLTTDDLAGAAAGSLTTTHRSSYECGIATDH